MSSAAPVPRDFRARVSVNGHSAAGPGHVRVEADGTDCGSGPAGPLRVAHDEVAELHRADLAVELRLFDGTRVTFDHGGSLDDLWTVLRAGFRARVAESLRFAPADPRHAFDAHLTLAAPEGFNALPARLSVVRLGLNYLCDAGPCAQVPFGSLGEAAFDPDAHQVLIPLVPGPAAPAGGSLQISRLARRTDEFLDVYRRARSASFADTATCLAALCPSLGTEARMSLAAELGVGRVVTRARCEALAPGGWRTLWDASAGPERAPYRDALERLAGDGDDIALGLRPYGGVPHGDGTAADEEADGDSDAGADSDLPVVYALALLPGSSGSDDRLALEVLSERRHATYVYRVSPAPAGLERRAAGAWLAATVSHTLLALDFRKEPLYLPEADLLAVREGLYRAAFRRLPALRELRARLVGRAIHTSPEAWASQLSTLT